MVGCEEESPSPTPQELVLQSTRYLPVEQDKLRISQERITNINAAIDSLGKFVSAQGNPELQSMYVDMVANMSEVIQDLKKQEAAAKSNIQTYSFYLSHYGDGVKEVELKDNP